MSNRLTILLASMGLAEAAGTEVVVRDLGLGLLRRGHRPIVYSPSVGEFAKSITARGVPVIDDLRLLREAPDIIHAQHLIPCGEALFRFPETPAVFVCHGFASWQAAPAHFPQIGVYVAVDDACRDRLVQSEGIDPQKVIVLRNAVDLSRVPARPAPLAPRPARALAFGKAAAVPELWSACDRLGLRLEAIGRARGNVRDYPEQELVQYDLVFASARSALEAICCGCAVIVCDPRGFAGLVTSKNYERLRKLNFGLRSLGEAVSVQRCIDEIGRYDPDDALAVSARARDDADLEKLLDNFELLYREVYDGSRKPVVTPDARNAAEARFLHDNLPRRPGDGRWPAMAEQDKLLRDNNTLTRHIEALRARLSSVESRLAEKDGEVAQLKRQSASAKRPIRAEDYSRS